MLTYLDLLVSDFGRINWADVIYAGDRVVPADGAIDGEVVGIHRFDFAILLVDRLDLAELDVVRVSEVEVVDNCACDEGFELRHRVELNCRHDLGWVERVWVRREEQLV